jgi:RNA-directed DNA polymerase
MKRIRGLIEPIADPDNLRLAFWKARKGKTHSPNVQAYSADLDANLKSLRTQILTGMVEVGNYHYFKVYEPKERQICAAAFSEQVLHHALMNVCHPYFERHQISDSYASRKGKGTYAALARAQRLTCNHQWFLKLDVRKFFESVHHGVVRAQLARMFKDPLLLEILGKILDSYEASPARGLPIGNLTSQYFANHYLSGLDHYIKEGLGIRAYVRYMDDMVLWHDKKTVLQAAQKAIETWVLEQLLSTLKPAQLSRTAQGLPLLGYLVKPYHVRLLQQSKVRFMRKFCLAEARLAVGEWSDVTYQRHVLPLLAFTQHANTVDFRRQIIFSNKVHRHRALTA